MEKKEFFEMFVSTVESVEEKKSELSGRLQKLPKQTNKGRRTKNKEISETDLIRSTNNSNLWNLCDIEDLEGTGQCSEAIPTAMLRGHSSRCHKSNPEPHM